MYTYSDITIFYREPQLTGYHFDIATKPAVILKLLSKTTCNYETGNKFNLHLDIKSLQEYILIDTGEMYVEKHNRLSDKSWPLIDLKNTDDIISIETAQVSLLLKDIYNGISF